MLKLSNEAAMDHALELAKIICANPNCDISPDDATAQDIADFIRTLETNLTTGE